MLKRSAALCAALGLIATAPGAAQHLVWGVESGMNRSKQIVESNNKAESASGFVVGSYVRLQFGKYFGFQPEFLLSRKGGLPPTEPLPLLGASSTGAPTFGPGRERMEILYTEVTALAHLQLWWDGAVRPFGIGGPALAIEVNCVEPLPEAVLNCQNSLQVDPGLVAGGGLDIQVVPWMLWTLEARHTWGLADINAVSPSIHNRTWSFMTGLALVLR
jgi:hypothetical protein